MHKRKTFIIIAVLAALILTGGSSYYLGTKSQQSRPETAAAEVVEPEPVENFPTAREDPVSADRIFELVNAERVKVGLQPLVRDARLDASAKAKCDDMVTRNYYTRMMTQTATWHGTISKKTAMSIQRLAKTSQTDV